MILKLKTTDEINECIEAQRKFEPHFAPSDGVCFRCHKNIYQNIGWRKQDLWTRTQVCLDDSEVNYVTGIPLERASSQLITGCPHCNRSYCD
jgi:hypothetical protein